MVENVETLSLAWSSYESNICSGLRSLQQQGEFVDMTLAADGHHVRVHQLVLSLASPYIKELINSSTSSHPVIFLNNMSYNTLTAILEYVYTGEAHIPKNALSELLQAANALHIIGLKELNTAVEYETGTNPRNAVNKKVKSVSNATLNSDDDIGNNQNMDLDETENVNWEPEAEEIEVLEPTTSMAEAEDSNVTDDEIKPEKEFNENTILKVVKVPKQVKLPQPRTIHIPKAHRGNVQYSLSNQCNLQVIFNRYIYNLRYVKKNLTKYWRCVDYAYRKCPANIYTNEKNEVIQRRCYHNHPYHDQKIMKKLRLKVVFGAFSEAEDRVLNKTEEKNELLQPSTQLEDKNITE